MQVASTRPAGWLTWLDIPGTEYSAVLAELAERHMVRAGQRRVIKGNRFTWAFTAEMVDGSGWWPVTPSAHKKLPK